MATPPKPRSRTRRAWTLLAENGVGILPVIETRSALRWTAKTARRGRDEVRGRCCGRRRDSFSDSRFCFFRWRAALRSKSLRLGSGALRSGSCRRLRNKRELRPASRWWSCCGSHASGDRGAHRRCELTDQPVPHPGENRDAVIHGYGNSKLQRFGGISANTVSDAAAQSERLSRIGLREQ